MPNMADGQCVCALRPLEELKDRTSRWSKNGLRFHHLPIPPFWPPLFNDAFQIRLEHYIEHCYLIQKNGKL
eukprot:6327195-Amphidinium_carterae.1